MKLSKILERLEYTCLQGTLDQEIEEVVADSRKAKEGSLFICIRGAVVDGHTFAKSVAGQGTKAIIVEEPVEVPEDVTVIQVKDSRYAMALVAAAYYDYPGDKLRVIGITGTKGKTTTTYMVKSILENAGYKVGLIGTIETIIGDTVIPSANTTPESLLVQKYLRQMLDEGCDCAVMEVSSQGLMLHRTAGFTFDIGIFTNIEPDHIGPNEHTSFDITCLVKRCYFVSAGSVLSTEMTNIMRRSLTDIPAAWRLTDFHRRQTFARSILNCLQKKECWESPMICRDC